MVKGIFRSTLLALLCSCTWSCAKDKTPRTELMLVADTDIQNLDTIRFDVTEGDRTESEEAAPRDDGEPLTLGILFSKGSLGPIRVTALGIRAGRTVVERTAVVSFVPNKTLVVVLHLLLSCESKLCLIGRSCGERGCEANQLDEEQLSEWTGSPPALGTTLLGDAGGVADGGSPASDASSLVTCGSDMNVDLSSDVDHCGDCQTACKASGRNIVAVCMAGECAEECRALTGDCDGNASNGCELSLVASTNCGMCGMRCASGTSCTLGSCR